MNDTIAAISTSLGVGAISVIRVSGPDSIKNVDKIFTQNLLKKESHTISYGFIRDKKEKIDEVLVSVMTSPKTFTREDVVEISCHGGVATTKKILSLLLSNGCRLAEPGEFTKRAFLNGRIDLIEAEAVMDLVSVKSEEARKLAINNLQGQTTKAIRILRDNLLDLIASIEVNIDYPEYTDIEEINNQKVKVLMADINGKLSNILKNSKDSRLIKEGINIAIVGRPNVGKSSLLNRILDEDKAIVTDIAGTTRDIVEGTITLDGMLLNFIDTAGIRKTENEIEKMGVKKSLQKIDDADLVLMVLNSNEALTKEDEDILNDIKDKRKLFVLNKNDLEKRIDENKLNGVIVHTNTLSKEGIDKLLNKIKDLFDFDNLSSKDFNYLSNIDQVAKLEECLKLLNEVEEGIKNEMPIDMIEIDIKSIWNSLGEIIGESYTEELLDKLFKNFCLGK
ncbi:MAG TPA: tRNA uridine-5-carboxymethylaminomethyl(34) synthesis GTPase MnmE [Bacilli bacterium]|nr:tRNA uridine-5-carboxymethylaminomethyl(34) synthesis GTPase MnmE [Bacilli bacterium]